jgi:hypothetical protein
LDQRSFSTFAGTLQAVLGAVISADMRCWWPPNRWTSAAAPGRVLRLEEARAAPLPRGIDAVVCRTLASPVALDNGGLERLLPASATWAR